MDFDNEKIFQETGRFPQIFFWPVLKTDRTRYHRRGRRNNDLQVNSRQSGRGFRGKPDENRPGRPNLAKGSGRP